MAGVSPNARFKRFQNFLAAYTERYRAACRITIREMDVIIAEVQAHEPPYDGRTPVHEAIIAFNDRVLDTMARHTP